MIVVRGSVFTDGACTLSVVDGACHDSRTHTNPVCRVVGLRSLSCSCAERSELRWARPLSGSMGDSMRSWRLRQLLEGRTSLTPRQVHDVFLDATNPARKEIVRVGYHLRDVLKRDLSNDALAALKRLENWHAEGARSRSDVPGN